MQNTLCKAKRGFAYEKSLLESVLRMNLPHLAADGVEHDHEPVRLAGG
jgi:hypothetical protein